MHELITSATNWILTAPADQGFFSEFWSDIKAYIAESDYWGLLSDPRIAIILGIAFVVGIILKTKAVPLLVFAAYGYTLTFHLAAKLKAKGAAGEEFVGSLDSVAVFILGVLVTTGVLIYFTMVKGD